MPGIILLPPASRGHRRYVYCQAHSPSDRAPRRGLTISIPYDVVHRLDLERGDPLELHVDASGRIVYTRGPQGVRTGRRVTREEEDQVVRNHREGLSAREIGGEIGRPKATILDAVARLRAEGRIQDPERKAEKWCPIPRVHAELSAYQLKLLRQREDHGAWPPDEVETLQWLIAHGYGRRVLVRVLRRHLEGPNGIREKALELGLSDDVPIQEVRHVE